MKKLRVRSAECRLWQEVVEKDSVQEVLALVREYFPGRCQIMLETPKSCGFRVLSQGAELTADSLTGLTCFDEQSELRAEQTGGRYAVRVLREGEEGQRVMYRETRCSLAENRALTEWLKASGPEGCVLVREYFRADEDSGMPVKFAERMCAPGKGESEQEETV